MKPIIKYFKSEIITTYNGNEYINEELETLLKEHHIEHRFVDVNQPFSWCYR